jgi:hypothetical protein
MPHPKTMLQFAVMGALLLIVSVFPFTVPHKQAIQPRYDYGAMLEPRGRILNGAGQDWPAFLNYGDAMHVNNKPAVCMTYVGLRDVRSVWSVDLKRELLAHPDHYVIPQIGLSMTVDGTPSAHYEQDVAAGLYDHQIRMFLDGLEALALPAYLRIGFEFNGTRWNGYHPDSYRAAFIRITDSIRARGLEVATVWDFSMDGDKDFKDYYPGDRYVDWWGINIFSAGHFSRSAASRFLDSAHSHRKPVMIGETAPRRVGVLNGSRSWDEWFVPFFTFIHTNPGVKMFCYINWNWSQYPQWHTWGDSRLEQNPIVRSLFAGQMDSTQYLHSCSESVLRKAFGSADTTPPVTPTNLCVASNRYPTTISWSPVVDSSKLSHYIVYKNGSLADYTLAPPYRDCNVVARESVAYAVSAMDRAGNESHLSRPVKVTIAPQLDKVINGEFDEGIDGWLEDTQNYGSFSTLEIDTTYAVSGRNSARVTITKLGRTSSDILLYQVLKLAKGQKYHFTFKGKSSVPKTIELSLVGPAEGSTVYYTRRFGLTSLVQSFADSVTIETTDRAYLEFELGDAPIGVVWIDGVSVLESQADR